MGKDVSHGIELMQFADAPASGKFPAESVWNGNDSASLRNFRAIKPGSFTENQDADETVDIEVEDAEGIYLTLNGKKGKKSFEVESYDLSDAALKYFMGYATADASADSNLTGYLVKPVNFEMKRQCMRILDRNVGSDDKRKVWLYMPCKVTGVISGARSKTELRTVKLTVVLEANFDATGKEIPNEAVKSVS